MNAELIRRGNDLVSSFSPMRKLMSEMMADPFFVDTPGVEETFLPVDIMETDKAVKVIASVPGFKASEVFVEVKDQVLTINAEKKEDVEEKGEAERWFRKERKVTSLSRRVTLPTAVVEAEAKAELKEGVLTLTLPKSLKALPKRIPIT